MKPQTRALDTVLYLINYAANYQELVSKVCTMTKWDLTEVFADVCVTYYVKNCLKFCYFSDWASYDLPAASCSKLG